MKLILSLLFLINAASAWAVVWYPLPKEAYSFGKKYPEAQRLLFAFDYGHALVYEKLLNSGGQIGNPEKFESDLLIEIKNILKNPPATKVDESDIAPQYVYTFPLTVELFDWSHMLHQFVLDVLATSADRGEVMNRRVEELFAQYKAKPEVSITDTCKSMNFMDGHYFSKTFRTKFPRFNLLIWSYHWFQIRLYEALLEPTEAGRDLAVQQTTKEFWQLISNLPDSAPFEMMPETAMEAPTFAKLFPTIPSAFDNNHMLHDIVSDILTSDRVADKRAEGLKAARMAQDPKAFKGVACGGDGGSGGDPGGPPVVAIQGNPDGSCTPTEVHLKTNREVQISFKADPSKMFLLSIPDFQIELMTMGADPATASLTPSRSGTFSFSCGPHGAPADKLTHGSIMVMD